jgi:hypothetical protein
MSLAHRILALTACLAAVATTGCVSPLGCGSCAHGPISFSQQSNGCGKCDGCGELYIDPWINHPPDCCDPCDRCGNHSGQSCGKCRSVFGGIRTLWGYRCDEGCDQGGQATCGCESPHAHCDSCVTQEAACGLEEPACGVDLVEPGCGIEAGCGLEPGCGIEPGCGVEVPYGAPFPTEIPQAPMIDAIQIESAPVGQVPQTGGRAVQITRDPQSAKRVTSARPASTSPTLRPYPQGTRRIFKARSDE